MDDAIEPVFITVPFGQGIIVIAKCEEDGVYGVIIAPSRHVRPVGDDATDELPLRGGFILTFPNEAQRDRVCAALKDQ